MWIPSQAWCLNLMMAAYLSKKTMAPIIGERSPLHVIFGPLTLFQTVYYSSEYSDARALFNPQSIPLHKTRQLCVFLSFWDEGS